MTHFEVPALWKFFNCFIILEKPRSMTLLFGSKIRASLIGVYCRQQTLYLLICTTGNSGIGFNIFLLAFNKKFLPTNNFFVSPFLSL